MSCKSLSIIIPCYNVEKYIQNCFDSLLNIIPNTLYNEIEIIIINDGSIDNTLQCISHYNWGNLESNVIVINKMNEGLSAARNDGLDIATGKYITFLDSDDIWLSDMTELLYTINEINSDIIEFNAIRFDSVSEINNKKSIFNYLGAGDIAVKELTIPYKKIIFSACIWMVWSRFFRKELIKNSRFPIGKTYEDIIFTSDLYNQAKTIFTYNKSCVGYRYNQDSITAKPKSIDIDSMAWVISQAKKRFLIDDNITSFLLLANSFIFFENLIYHLTKNSANTHDDTRKLIINSKYFKILPWSKRIKIKYPKIFHKMKSIIMNIKVKYD